MMISEFQWQRGLSAFMGQENKTWYWMEHESEFLDNFVDISS